MPQRRPPLKRRIKLALASSAVAISTIFTSACDHLVTSDDEITQAINNGHAKEVATVFSWYKADMGGINIGAASRKRMAKGLPPITATGVDYVPGLTAAVDPSRYGGIKELTRRARNGTSPILIMDKNDNGVYDLGDERRIATDTGGAIKGNRVDWSAPAGVDNSYPLQQGRQTHKMWVVYPDQINQIPVPQIPISIPAM